MAQGFYITKEGYVKVIVPKNHPLRKTGHRYMFLHRLVMEGIVGRYLDSKERVHHKDGNRQNNHPSNLELFENQSLHAKRGVRNARIYKRLWNAGWLEERYLKRKMSCREIAKTLGCGEGTVRNALIVRKIKRRRYTLTKKALKARHKGAIALKPRNLNPKEAV